MTDIKAIFKKHGYTNVENEIDDLIEGYEVHFDMNDDHITDLANDINATKDFIAYLDNSTDFMIIEKDI
ncbi:hypothetical protein IA826_02300 [Listeria seeligeri]|uniref:hypothetical protein n=1 Tax=Listeria seeligeri TaxID=1640 RepID=UPI001624EB4D|nr:hypothetical protein [Listeria seeligeri]MBC2069870.1 hypothetical protein [Listeria seeligeri]MBC2087868.1 hypothetical protein [Listeria seeligeri]MBF2400562.1 hypothetical protein [Listeria seeligeri]MBF2499610.1 hypothetical protein [Listeria seeligeri]MBF2651822.1 hypothetical protein [Listeria seeligeri]